MDRYSLTNLKNHFDISKNKNLKETKVHSFVWVLEFRMKYLLNQ